MFSRLPSSYLSSFSHICKVLREGAGKGTSHHINTGYDASLHYNVNVTPIKSPWPPQQTRLNQFGYYLITDCDLPRTKHIVHLNNAKNKTIHKQNNKISLRNGGCIYVFAAYQQHRGHETVCRIAEFLAMN